MLNRLLLAAAALVLAVLAGAPLLADDQKGGAGDKPGDKPAANQGVSYFEGRIASVDATKREITLNDARQSGATGTGTGTGTDKDKDKDKPSDKPGDKPGDKPAAGGTGSDKGRAMTFTVGDKTRITLDGKEVMLDSLKSDLYCRVYVSGVGGSTGTGTGTGTDKDKPATGGDKDKDKTGTGSAGARMMAERIEASTKAFPSGTGTDKPK